jgi:hypothetical protein
METQVAKTEMVHGAVVTTIMLTAALAVLLANKRQFIKFAWASCLLLLGGTFCPFNYLDRRLTVYLRRIL